MDEPQYKHPHSQGIHNTIEGSNYLRASEHRAIIEELEILQQIREHVGSCPIGWVDGTVRMSRRTTDADVIEWVWELRQLTGLEADGGDEHG